MTHNTEDGAEDVLAEIDLNVWRVPPPAAIDRSSLLVRALSPAATPARRPRLAWIMAAVVLLNAAIAALIVILLARAPVTQTTVVQPAGGGSVDAHVRELLARLEQEQRELERKLAEIQELRARVIELSEKLRYYEQQDAKRERTLPKQRDRQVPARVDRQPVVRQPVDPFGSPPPEVGTCDEVSCVLNNYPDACCAKFRRPPVTQPELPEGLDRESISRGIASVKGTIAKCADGSTPKGKVKLKVFVGSNGVVGRAAVEATPDAALGECVAAAMRRAVFPQTQRGGMFSYPFVF